MWLGFGQETSEESPKDIGPDPGVIDRVGYWVLRTGLAPREFADCGRLPRGASSGGRVDLREQHSRQH